MMRSVTRSSSLGAVSRRSIVFCTVLALGPVTVNGFDDAPVPGARWWGGVLGHAVIVSD
ncbi:hypothetical protein [Mycobacterium sp. TY813]|uniref:hypothetical protein n=1 Tax=Mycobacterium TaxID=1763 RepID=UPI0027409709|nr:hypothetical protein [Mycobacterium sp. TY813]MDP7732920.1 hypothetical protein [Mycobacterium sp. TY813]